MIGSGGPGDAGRATGWVTALLVAHDGAAWLPRCLAAVLAQGADEVVAVDTGSTDDSPQLLRAAFGEDRVVVADRRTGFGDAVRQGIAHADERPADRPAAEQRWFWLLHDDCAPEPGALDALLDTAARSRHAGIVGPKLVAWDDPTRLLEVGLTVSRGGRRFTGIDGPERDQGQHDEVTDVLALGTAGLLVRADVWADLDGLDPALPLLRDDVDLGWRAQLAGYRVVLATRALVADAQASTRGLRHVDAVRGPLRRVDRVHAMRVALARCSPWSVLPLLCWLLLAGVGRAVGLLAAKAPRRSLDELVATATAALTPWQWLALRWRGRATVRVRRRDINQLLEPRLAVVRRAVDAVGVLAAREPDNSDEASPVVLAEPGPTSDEADVVAVAPRLWLRRLATHPLTLLVLALAVVTAVSWRGLLGRVLAHPALVGGELSRATGRPGDLWQSALGGWSGSGLAVDVVASPAAFVRAGAVTVLHPMAGDQAGALAVLLLLLLAPVLSAVAAYLALTGFMRSRWARAWAGLAWATVPVVAPAVAGGRLGVLVALLLLPLVVAAFARALAPGRRGSTTAAFAGSVGVALLAAAAPVMLVPAVVVALVGVVAGRGSARLRSLALLLVPLGLLGPWLGALLSDPRRLLAGPGLLAPAATAGRAGGWLELDSVRPWANLVRPPDGVPTWIVLAAAAPVLLAGLAGVLRAGPRGRALLALWLIGAAGLAAALIAPFVVLERGATGPLGPWSGTALLLTALAAVTSAAVGADGLRSRLLVHGFGWRQVLVAPVVALAVLGPIAGAGLAAWRGAAGPLASGATATLPAVVAAAAQGPAGVRTLELRTAGSTMTYRLDGVEPGPWSRDLAVASPATGGPADDPVLSVVRDLVDGPAGFAAGEAAVEQLGRLAVGFVLVRGDVPATVLTRLDSTAGLARIGAPTGSALWRVGTGGLGTGSAAALGAGQERPARVRVETPDGAVLQTLPVAGAHAATSVTLVAGGSSAKDATSTDRLLVLAERESPRWRATLNGQALPSVRPQTAPWRQAFRLPEGAGHLVVSYDRTDQRWWRVGQGVLAGLVLLLAMPVRRPSQESS